MTMINRPHHTLRPTVTASAPDHTNAITFGWRVHQAQEAWTAKVDVKASIVLALDGAVLVAIIAGHNKDGVLTELTGWRSLIEVLAAISILVALVLAGLVVRPALGPSRQHRAQHSAHIIYFGHLRHWDPPQLATRLRSLTPDEETDQLAQQVVSMSQRNWWKHRLLQWALYTTALAALLLAVATLWPR
ncbi:Pycsar system effector family protein [Nocardia gipuzkoensis]